MRAEVIDHRQRADYDGRLLIAYANDSTHVATTREYLECFARHSRFEVRYVHVTRKAEIDFDLNQFDIVFQSYCARLPFENYVSPQFLAKLRGFTGLKLLAVQDEYDETDRLEAAIRDTGYHVVLTCIPRNQIDRVYPPQMFPGTEFVTVLTGYVPECPEIRRVAPLPLAERPIAVGYRGRDIGGRYGRLAFDKLEIGRRMRAVCEARGIPHDIEWEDSKRIYGEAWYDFLASCRAVLGSESGSNVFDFDGSIAARYRAMAEDRDGPVPYDEFRRYTDPIEAGFDIGQISPRIFEAAALRTPMILYSGRYSGLLEPETHYIELRKDFSNLDQVLARLNDLDGLEAMVERAYRHLVASDQFSYRRFVRLIEDIAIRRAAEHGIALSRQERPPLAREPAFDLAGAASLRERPTRMPRHPIHFFYKASAEENRRLGAEIARLNSVYQAEIIRLNSVYSAEIARLNDLVARQTCQAQTEPATGALLHLLVRRCAHRIINHLPEHLGRGVRCSLNVLRRRLALLRDRAAE
jgi:hypothetical protein